MALRSPHRDWRIPQINPLDVRAVDLDAVLTRLWLRIEHANRPLAARPSSNTKVSELANELEGRANENFRGFADSPGMAEAWLRADLVKTLRRKPDLFTVARPVHALATRIRSGDRQTDDSLASLAVYSWLTIADKGLISELRRFIDVDLEEGDGDGTDLATYALALLGAQRAPDSRKSDEPAEMSRPLCLGQAKIYAEDLRRLLAYQGAMPRAALIDHIRRLTGLHLGLYLLRVFRIAVEAEQGADSPRCPSCLVGRAPRGGICPHDLELVVDCGEDARSPVAKLAEESWADQEDILARYVRSHLALKKLQEFAEYLEKDQPADKLPHDSLEQIAAVEEAARGELIDVYFNLRIEQVVEQMGADDGGARGRDLVRQYRSIGLTPFRTYIALLAHYSERRWVAYHRQLLDSLWSKNSSEGMLRQPLGGPRRRRAAMGAALLETLTLLAVVDGEPGRYFTRPLQVDELIDRLELRYGIRVATPPSAAAQDIEVPQHLAVNVDRFKARLRETGLFTDLSDAFLAQRVRPRHKVGATL
jgi:hypothetical protein